MGQELIPVHFGLLFAVLALAALRFMCATTGTPMRRGFACLSLLRALSLRLRKARGTLPGATLLFGLILLLCRAAVFLLLRLIGGTLRLCILGSLAIAAFRTLGGLRTAAFHTTLALLLLVFATCGFAARTLLALRIALLFNHSLRGSAARTATTRRTALLLVGFGLA